LAGAGVFQHERVNSGLGDAGLAATFSHGDDEGRRRCEGEHFVGDEVVGEDNVGGLEQAKGAQGEEFRVAWPRADQIDGARLG
jgi:hypothetical protein